MNELHEWMRRILVVLVSGVCLFGLYKAWQEGYIKLGFDGTRTALEIGER
ncbi:MAG: hypothetical protein AB7F75_07535 [Planctomycetota bacterium]